MAALSWTCGASVKSRPLLTIVGPESGPFSAGAEADWFRFSGGPAAARADNGPVRARSARSRPAAAARRARWDRPGGRTRRSCAASPPARPEPTRGRRRGRRARSPAEPVLDILAETAELLLEPVILVLRLLDLPVRAPQVRLEPVDPHDQFGRIARIDGIAGDRGRRQVRLRDAGRPWLIRRSEVEGPGAARAGERSEENGKPSGAMEESRCHQFRPHVSGRAAEHPTRAAQLP